MYEELLKCIRDNTEPLESIDDALTTNTEQHIIAADTDSSVPAGFASVRIMRLSGDVTVDAGNGTFILNQDHCAHAFNATQTLGVAGSLPAITITGGSWQWVALNVIGV